MIASAYTDVNKSSVGSSVGKESNLMQYYRKQSKNSEPSQRGNSPPKAPQHATIVPRKTSIGKETKTQTERVIDGIKRHPVVLIAGLFLALLAAVSTAFSNFDTIITDLGKYVPSIIATPAHVNNLCMNATGSNENATSPSLGFTFCTYHGHRGLVNTLAWSPNGKRIASAGSDGTVQVWDATAGGKTIIYRGHKGSVNAVAWSPYGQRIASGGVDGTVQVWVSDTGSLVYSYDSFEKISALAWSPDGQWIAYGTEEGDVGIFDALKGDIESVSYGLNSPNKYGRVQDLSWSPGSKLIAIAYSGYYSPSFLHGHVGHVEIWNHDLTKHIITYNPPDVNLYVGPMSWSPDGKFIAFASYPNQGDGSSLGLRNVSRGNSSYDSGFNPGVQALAWSCDSNQIALGSEIPGIVYLWDIRTRKQIFLYQAQVGGITALAWSPDGALIASASDDGTIRIWQASDKKLC